MLNKRLPILIAGLVAGSIALAGCSTPAEEPVNTGDTTISTPDAGTSTPDVDEPTDDAGETTVPEGDGDTAAGDTVDAATLTDGATLDLKVGTLVKVEAVDPTQLTLMTTDNTIVMVESIPADNEAGYDIGLRVLAPGTTELGVYDNATGETANVTVTAS